MSRGSSDVTTEYIPLQYVSWLNMARGLSEVTTEYVPLQYVSWFVWGYNRICPAAICLVARLMLQPNTSRCNMYLTFLHCSLLYLTYTKVTISWEDLKNALKWYAWSPKLDLITFWHCSILYLAHFFGIAHFCTSLTLKFKLKGRYLEMIWKMLQNDMHEV